MPKELSNLERIQELEKRMYTLECRMTDLENLPDLLRQTLENYEPNKNNQR